MRRVQRSLGVSADGSFGKQTVRALKRFQRSHGLTADGVVGPMTRRALGLRAFARDSVVKKGSRKHAKRKVSSPSGSAVSVLADIAECESGGVPTAVSGSGQYRGKYQFSRSTWRVNGGEGKDPAKADESEQDRVALKLFRARGTAPWPVCGRGAGDE